MPAWTAYLDARSAPAPSGCIEWTGPVDRYGYGRFRAQIDGRRRAMAASRAAWLARRGVIPLGMVPDHLCRNRRCVNVEHMELVTGAENTRRGKSGLPLGSRHADALGPEYPCGHPRTATNTYLRVSKRTGYTARSCRTCNRERVRAWLAKRSAA